MIGRKKPAVPPKENHAKANHDPVKFPTMLYKDVDGNGDVSEPSNQATAKSAAELSALLADGWVRHPSEI